MPLERKLEILGTPFGESDFRTIFRHSSPHPFRLCSPGGSSLLKLCYPVSMCLFRPRNIAWPQLGVLPSYGLSITRTSPAMDNNPHLKD